MTSELPGGKTQFDTIRREYSATTREAQRLERAITTQTAKAATLGESLRGAGVNTSALSREQVRLASELKRAGVAADQQRRDLNAATEIAQMRERNVMLRTTTELERIRAREVLGHYAQYSASQMREIKLLAAENDMIRRQIASERELTTVRATRKAGIGSGVATGALAVAGGGLLASPAGAGLAVAGGLFASSRTAQEFERAEKALTAITGSLAEARIQMDFVDAQSERLGNSITRTAQSYSRFLAASKGTNLEGKASQEIFLSVSEAAGTLKLSADQTQGALTAIEQIMSKGKVQAEELRGQLGERLPGAFQIAARAMGVTTAELDKMLSTGQVTADEFLPKFARELRRTFGTDSESRIDAHSASFQRLGNEISFVADSIGSKLNVVLAAAAEATASALRAARQDQAQSSQGGFGLGGGFAEQVAASRRTESEPGRLVDLTAFRRASTPPVADATPDKDGATKTLEATKATTREVEQQRELEADRIRQVMARNAELKQELATGQNLTQSQRELLRLEFDEADVSKTTLEHELAAGVALEAQQGAARRLNQAQADREKMMREQLELAQRLRVESDRAIRDDPTARAFGIGSLEDLESAMRPAHAAALQMGDAFDQALSNARDSTSELIANFVLMGDKGELSVKKIAAAMAQDLVQGLAGVGLQMGINFAAAQVFGSAALGTTALQAASSAVAWAPAAALASLATVGANAAPAAAALTGTVALGETLAVSSDVLAAATAGGRAFGGSVKAGQMYKVGELNEPELFRQSGPSGSELYMIPPKDGYVTPAARGSAASSSMGGMKVNVHNYGGERVTTRQRSDGEIDILIGQAEDRAYRRSMEKFRSDFANREGVALAFESGYQAPRKGNKGGF
ncbi:MAG: tape measure protein [Pseudomonadota bacterium]|nr:tape measure protein [Pseudomonadota bacterium]